MSLADKVSEMMNRNSAVSLEEIDEVLKDPSLDEEIDGIIDCVLQGLEYPNLNALNFVYHFPLKSFEEKLLSYKPEEMYNDHASTWMLALGKMHSEKAFERIIPYTETRHSHQAFISLARINPAKTAPIFEKYMDARQHLYEAKKSANDGFQTFFMMLEDYEGSPEEFVKDYDLSNNAKNKFVAGAIACLKKYKETGHARFYLSED